MKRLLQGYEKFRREVFPQLKDSFRLLSDRQAPDTLFITCADSRVVPNLIFQADPGDLFLCRTVGNVVPPHGQMPGGVSSTIEYAVAILKVRHVVVCGHSDCGAIRAVLPGNRAASFSRLPLTAKWLGFVEPAWKYLEPGIPATDAGALHKGLIHANVIAQLENLRTHPEVARALAQQEVQIHGWYYDILTGGIEAWDEQERRFAPLEAQAEQDAALPAKS
jgi:carbonic anhydrase